MRAIRRGLPHAFLNDTKRSPASRLPRISPEVSGYSRTRVRCPVFPHDKSHFTNLNRHRAGGQDFDFEALISEGQPTRTSRGPLRPAATPVRQMGPGPGPRRPLGMA